MKKQKTKFTKKERNAIYKKILNDYKGKEFICFCLKPLVSPNKFRYAYSVASELEVLKGLFPEFGKVFDKYTGKTGTIALDKGEYNGKFRELYEVRRMVLCEAIKLSNPVKKKK